MTMFEAQYTNQQEARVTVVAEDQVAGEIKPEEEKKERQVSLFPKRPNPPLPIEDGIWIDCDKLPSTKGVEPDPAFIENVMQVGIVFPLILRDTKKGYQLVDGKRRLETARRLGDDQVRCDVYPMTARFGAIMTLVANYHRSSNPVSELHAMETLLKGNGVNPKLIAEQLGINLLVVEKRLKLRALIPELRAAFDDGRMKVTVAESATRLEPARQHDLVPILEENGKITMDDVKAQLATRAKEASDTLPKNMFPDATPEPTTDMIKVERCVLEDTAETLAYAADMLKAVHKGGGGKSAMVDGVGAMATKLEALARAYRVLADE